LRQHGVDGVDEFFHDVLPFAVLAPRSILSDILQMEASTSPNLFQLANFEKPMTTPAAFDRLSGRSLGLESGGNPEFAVIETHLSRRFVQTCDNRTHYAVDVIGGGRSSAIMLKMSAKTLRGIANLVHLEPD